MSDLDRFRSRLQAVIAERLGAPGEINNLTRLTGGATRTTWSLDALIGDAVQRLIFQQSLDRRPGPGDPIGRLARVSGDNDALLMMAAGRRGIPVPRVRLILSPGDGLGTGFITDRIDGETLGRRINQDPRLEHARAKMTAQCGHILAAIHDMEINEVPFLIQQDAGEQVGVYRDIWDSFDHPVAAMEVGFKWAAAHIPRQARTTLVHGDFRNGNFVVAEDGIRAILDWELAHLGDPVEDVGWLLVKTWRFGGALPVGGFGSREQFLESYEKARGIQVSAEHVMFWEAFGCLKWAVMCMIKGQSYLSDRRERTVEALAIGRRTEEPVYDFLNLIYSRG